LASYALFGPGVNFTVNWSFDVRITVPRNYVVAATGMLQNVDEKEWLLQRSGFKWQPKKQKVKSKSGIVKTVKQEFPASSTETKTIQYKQDSVHDFAMVSPTNDS
jgi:hypothetical protein